MSPNLITNIILHIQKPKQTPSMMNLKRSTSRYITNCQKVKRKRKIKTFSDKQKLEEFVASVPILQDILMGPPDWNQRIQENNFNMTIIAQKGEVMEFFYII